MLARVPVPRGQAAALQGGMQEPSPGVESPTSSRPLFQRLAVICSLLDLPGNGQMESALDMYSRAFPSASIPLHITPAMDQDQDGSPQQDGAEVGLVPEVFPHE